MNTRMQVIRDEVWQMVRANPFHPFFLLLKNGERVLVAHPENIAFNAGNEDGAGGSPFFYVIGDKLRTAGTFDAATNIVTLDRAEV